MDTAHYIMFGSIIIALSIQQSSSVAMRLAVSLSRCDADIIRIRPVLDRSMRCLAILLRPRFKAYIVLQSKSIVCKAEQSSSILRVPECPHASPF